MLIGNYDVRWSRAWDFHTDILAITPCFTPDGQDVTPGCLQVSRVPQPIAKAYQWRSSAKLVDGRYSMTVDVPDGYGCGGYYGPTVPTRDVWNWDPVTLIGTMDSTFETGACGPGATVSYPFTLTRL